jgi:hypothetical protein
MPSTPKTPTAFEQDLLALIRKHLSTPQRMADYFPIMDALDEVGERLAREADRRFPQGAMIWLLP